MNPPELVPTAAVPAFGAVSAYASFSTAAKKILLEKDLTRILQVICEEACRILGADRSMVVRVKMDGSYQRDILYAHNFPQNCLDCIKASRTKPLLSEVYQERGMVVYSNFEAKSKIFSPDEIRRLGIRTLCGIPLFVEGEILAVLSLYHAEDREYGPEERQIAEAFGDLASIAIEKARLVDTLEARIAEERGLVRAMGKIASGRDAGEIIREVLAESLPVMGTERCSIMLPDSTTGEPKLFVSQGISPEFVEALSALPDPFPIGRAYLSDPDRDAPLIVPDATADPEYGSIQDREGHRTMTAFPLRVEQRNIGALFFFWTESQEIGEERIALGRAFAYQAAIAIQNSRLLAETEGRAERLAVTAEIARVVGSEIEPEELFRTIVREIRRVVPCERCVISSVDPDTLKFHYWHTESDVDLDENRLDNDLAKWLIHELYEPLKPLHSNNTLDSPIAQVRQLAEAGLTATLLIPVPRDGRCIAHLVLSSIREGAFSAEQEELLTSIAEHLGPAIRNAELHRESQARAERLAVLNDLNQKISENLDLSDVLDKIVRAVVELIHGEHSRIFLLDETSGRLALRATHGRIPGPPEEGLTFRVGEGVIGKLAQSGEAVILPDVQEEPGWATAKWVREAGVHSYIAAPLRQSGKVIGVINCFSREKNFFSEEDLDFLNALATQAAVAIENARLHEEAQRSREFLNRVVSDSGNPIIIVDTGGEIILWNSGAEFLYGYSAAEVLGENIDLIVREDEREKRISNVAHLLKGGGSFTYESHRLRRDGTPVPVSITISTVKDSKGEVIGISGIHTDLTERKNAEETLKRAKEEAEAANSAKSEFLSNMSHELRSPLNAVVGFSDILMLQSSDERTLYLAEKIKDSGQYLTRLIEELLDLDRIEEGKVRMEMEEISMNDLVSEVAAAWQLRLPDNFSLRCELDFSIRPVFCDPTRAKQILMNLLENSVKYSSAGGLLTIRTEARPGEIWTSVQDQGIGIDPEEQEVIFDRFHQLESGYRRSAGGLGIGLSLVQKLVELHGGRIWVDSAKNIGSTFTFALPYSKEEDSAGLHEDLSSFAEEEGREPWDGKKILFVDDVEHYHEFLRLLMKSAKEFYSAYNGEEGIEIAAQNRPDIILMDLRMPVLDGFDATMRLKSDPETRDIPVVAVTAQAMQEDKERALEAGAAGFITKPIDLDTFRNVLKEFLE